MISYVVRSDATARVNQDSKQQEARMDQCGQERSPNVVKKAGDKEGGKNEMYLSKLFKYQ